MEICVRLIEKACERAHVESRKDSREISSKQSADHPIYQGKVS